ncbi:hypothetical protein ColTof4_14422 [Colletotrichum tofieldiae]|nr:hypothetical protein ColTof3_14858 [Colletotrichum tofieldiae]GKT81999.1 hypothetical protein ColTof4_14422 [Colletotrichum tofieldiae]
MNSGPTTTSSITSTSTVYRTLWTPITGGDFDRLLIDYTAGEDSVSSFSTAAGRPNQYGIGSDDPSDMTNVPSGHRIVLQAMLLKKHGQLKPHHAEWVRSQQYAGNDNRGSRPLAAAVPLSGPVPRSLLQSDEAVTPAVSSSNNPFVTTLPPVQAAST